MRTFRRAIPMLALPLLLAACGEEEAAAETPIPERTVEQVAAGLAAGDLVVFDANSAETRAEHGIVPGARLLTSSSQYDVEAELPDDTSASLVFYCGNTNCRASDGAAERAREHGYANVSVMRAGIAGWVEAGQQVEQPNS